MISSDDVRGFYVLLRNSFKRKKNEVIVLSLIIRLFTCVILLGVAVCKAVRCGIGLGWGFGGAKLIIIHYYRSEEGQI